MPTAPNSRCPRCRRIKLTPTPGPCPTCRATADRKIKTASPWRWVYTDPRWQKLRTQVLTEQPHCACGCGQPSTVVDHITPHRGDPDLAFDRTNLRGMTKRCHDRVTAQASWGGRVKSSGTDGS